MTVQDEKPKRSAEEKAARKARKALKRKESQDADAALAPPAKAPKAEPAAAVEASAKPSETIKPKSKKLKKTKSEKLDTKEPKSENLESEKTKSKKLETKEPKSKKLKEPKSKKSDESIYRYSQSAALSALSSANVDAFLEKHNVQIQDTQSHLAASRLPIIDFALVEFPKAINDVFKHTLKFDNPSPIQACSWPHVLSKRDLVGIAATGSGKTFAFGIPALIHILNVKAQQKTNPLPRTTKTSPLVIVLSPTRELAIQIKDTLNVFTQALGIQSVCVYGGVPKWEQKKALLENGGADIVIATPGRFIDLLGLQGDSGQDDSCISLDRVSFFILDEADRMLDLGFQRDIRRIADAMKMADKQTVMFSATWPKEVQSLAMSYLNDPLRVTIGNRDTLSANKSITQIVEVVKPEQKEQKLLELLNRYHSSRKNRVLIFVLYKKEAARVEAFVKRNGWKCRAIHGDLNQYQRSEGLEAFRNGSCPLLIATDVAARGIDVQDVSHVINHTFPLTTEEYCHRIGRTGRAGKTGISHTFFTVHDKTHSGALINVLKGAGQTVPDDLFQFGTTVKKKVDPNYGAFARDVDMSQKGTKIVFDDSE